MQNYTKQNNTIQIAAAQQWVLNKGESNPCLSDGVKLKDEVTVQFSS